MTNPRLVLGAIGLTAASVSACKFDHYRHSTGPTRARSRRARHPNP